MAWIESKERLVNHPMIYLLSEILGIPRVQAIGHVFCLWDTAATFEEHERKGLSAHYVSYAGKWDGDQDVFYKALQETGWITLGGDIDFKECAHVVYIRGKRTHQYEWRRLRLKILARDKYTCNYCGEKKRKMQVDHVVPVAKGGTDSESNLVAACQDCNIRKKHFTVEEFTKKMNAISEP